MEIGTVDKLSQKNNMPTLESLVCNGILNNHPSEVQLVSMINLAYGLMFPGKKQKAKIRILPDDKMDKRYGKDVTGIAEEGFFSGYTISIREHFDPNHLMRVAGHELGHAYKGLCFNFQYGETAAELFRFFFEDVIMRYDVGGLSSGQQGFRKTYEAQGRCTPFRTSNYRIPNILAWCIYQRNEGNIEGAFRDFDELRARPSLIPEYTNGRLVLNS